MNRTRPGTRWQQDEGSATLEALVCVAVLIPFLCLLVAFGMAGLGDSTAANAAAAAARAASRAGDPSTARAQGQRAAETSLAQAQRTCASSEISIDTSRFPTQPGTAGMVTVRVQCTVPLSQLLVPGLPGHKTLTASRISYVDQYAVKGDGFTNSEGFSGSNPGSEGP